MNSIKSFLNRIEYTKPTIIFLLLASSAGMVVLTVMFVLVANHTALGTEPRFAQAVYITNAALIVLNCIIARIAFMTGKKSTAGNTCNPAA
jgi:hypothetical protein